jgi:hypothetical protein
MDDTLGLLEEALQLAREVGHHVREEPLGDLPGGPCVISGRRTILLNLQSPAADRLTVLLGVLARDPDVANQPVSRLLATRLKSINPDETRSQ